MGGVVVEMKAATPAAPPEPDSSELAYTQIPLVADRNPDNNGGDQP